VIKKRNLFIFWTSFALYIRNIVWTMVGLGLSF